MRILLFGSYDNRQHERAQVLLEKYPEHPKAMLVRHLIGLTHYRRGELGVSALGEQLMLD